MTDTATTGIEDSIAKVDNELAVGEDLEFQRRWWKLERWVWRIFALLVLCDFLGVFGRGPLAHAHAKTADGVLSVGYDRVERFSTPSTLTVRFGPAAVNHGQILLWVGNSLVQRLGNQRISPEPASTTMTGGGLLYTFPAQATGGRVEFSLQPGKIGSSKLAISVVSHGTLQQPQDTLNLSFFTMP